MKTSHATVQSLQSLHELLCLLGDVFCAERRAVTGVGRSSADNGAGRRLKKQPSADHSTEGCYPFYILFTILLFLIVRYGLPCHTHALG